MKIAAGVDAGSGFTRCMILGLDGSIVRFLGCGEVASTGWHKGRVADHESLSSSIYEAVTEASRQAQVEIESVVVGVGGPAVYGFNHYWPYEFVRPREVSSSDLRFAIDRASDVRLEHDRMLLHVCPQDFSVDGRARYRFPRGANCKRLEAYVHLTTTSTQETHAIVSAVHRAHLAVQETVFEPLAAAYACILPEDRARGVALIDIGFHSTDIVVYDGDALVHSASIPVCGEHFTKDLAWDLTVPYETAELVKRQHGCAIRGLTGDASYVVMPPVNGHGERSVPLRRVFEVLEARAEELFGHVEAHLKHAGMEQSLVEGVVLTGGGALLQGMCDMAEKVLNCQAQIGLTVGVKDFPDACDAPYWTSAAGLAMYSARLKIRDHGKRTAPGLLGLVMR